MESEFLAANTVSSVNVAAGNDPDRQLFHFLDRKIQPVHRLTNQERK